MPQNKSPGSGNGTSNRGFASMDQRKQREIASKGGRSVAAEDRSFSQNRALAAAAGRKGGQASHGGRRGHPRPAALKPLVLGEAQAALAAVPGEREDEADATNGAGNGRDSN